MNLQELRTRVTNGHYNTKIRTKEILESVHSTSESYGTQFMRRHEDQLRLNAEFRKDTYAAIEGTQILHTLADALFKYLPDNRDAHLRICQVLSEVSGTL